MFRQEGHAIRPFSWNRVAVGLVRFWHREPERPFRALHRSGLAGVALYTVAAIFFYFSGSDHTSASEPFRWALIAGLLYAFVSGDRAVRAVPDAPRVRRIVVGYGVLLVLVAAVVPAFHSTDVSSYINSGWQQVRYGVNPYQVLLYEMPTGLTDPMFVQQWQFVPCSYGFLTALQAKAACLVSGPDHGVAVGVLKVSACLTLLAVGAVAWVGSGAAGGPRSIRAAYLVLWNPLLLLHCVSNAHNDLQLGLGVAVAVVAAVSGRWFWVFPGLAAAALVKYVSVILLPFLFLASIRSYGLMRTGVSLTAAAGIVVVCWWPYQDGFDFTYFSRMGTNLSLAHTSLASVVEFPAEVLAKSIPGLRDQRPAFQNAVRLACWGAFAVFYGALLLGRLRRSASREDTIRDSTLVLLVFLLASPKFHSWYLAMVVPVAVCLPMGSTLRKAVLALGVANLLSFTFVYQAHFLNAVLMLVVPLWLVLRATPGRGKGPEALVGSGSVIPVIWRGPRPSPVGGK